MKKTLLVLFLVVVLVMSCAAAAFAADPPVGEEGVSDVTSEDAIGDDAVVTPGMSNFVRTLTYTTGQFSDVASDAWYAANVATAYELGLMQGNSATNFNVVGNLSLAETITMAARLHSIYNTGQTLTLEATSSWYAPYVDYAKENSIISNDYADYSKSATRAEFAVIFANALPAEALEAINTVDTIPDVTADVSYGPAVFTLYKAGILTGNSVGAFNPDSNILRSEASAIVTRMADKTLRQLTNAIPADAEEGTSTDGEATGDEEGTSTDGDTEPSAN